MATGGFDRSCVDSRSTCSVCLEPYKGRQPKLLPCFHTFCLPCLTELAKRQDRTAVSDEAAGDASFGQGSQVIVTCPSCRKDIPVPPGGVSEFQTNFYLDDEPDQDHVQPLLCDLCDKGNMANYHCTKCKRMLCVQCHRGHDKRCRRTSLTSPSKENEGQVDVLQKVKDQVRVLDDVLGGIAAKEKEVEKQRKAVEHDINVRYATVLGIIADARDECFRSLRDASQTLKEKLDADRTATGSVQTNLSQLLSQADHSGPSCAWNTEAQSAVLNSSDLERYALYTSDAVEKCQGEVIFDFQKNDNCTPSVQAYMGRVVLCGDETREAQETSTSSETSIASNSGAAHHAASDLQGTAQDVQQKLLSRLDDLTCKVNALQSTNMVFSRDLNSVNEKHDKLCCDFTKLQKETSSLRQSVLSLQTENLKLRQDITHVGDKNMLLCQETAALQSENTKLHQDLTSVTASVSKLQQDTSSIQKENTKLAGDQARQAAEQTKCCQDVASVQVELTKTCSEQTALRSDTDGLKEEVTDAKTQAEKVGKDLTSTGEKITSLQQQLTSLQKSHQTQSAKMTGFENRLTKSTKAVAFLAILDKHVTTNTKKTLFCKYIVSNIGDGYDGETGIFTAPVTGTYLFIATTSPWMEGKQAKLCLMLEDEDIAYLMSLNYASSSMHAAVEVSAGQKVWLQTFEGDNRYYGGWLTSFSGVLLQPKL